MIRFIVFSALLLLGLAACSNTDYNIDTARELFFPNKQEFVERYKRAAQRGAPQLKLALLEFEEGSLVVQDSTRDGVITWITPDGGTIKTREQIIVGMIGFGAGLLAADVDDTLAMIQTGNQGVADRFHTYLTGENKTVTRTYRCVIAPIPGAQQIVLGTSAVETQLISEDCRSLDQHFQNFYWVMPGNRRIVQTSQWTGEFVGVVGTQVIP